MTKGKEDGINWNQLTLENTNSITALATQVSAFVDQVKEDRIISSARHEEYHKMFTALTESNTSNKGKIKELATKINPYIIILHAAAGMILTAFMTALIVLVFKSAGILKF